MKSEAFDRHPRIMNHSSWLIFQQLKVICNKSLLNPTRQTMIIQRRYQVITSLQEIVILIQLLYKSDNNIHHFMFDNFYTFYLISENVAVGSMDVAFCFPCCLENIFRYDSNCFYNV